MGKGKSGKIIRGQGGQALVLVLVLLLLAGLLLAMLAYVTTSLGAHRVTDIKTRALYACDSGIENYLARWLNGTADPSCNLTNINGMDLVSVTQVGEPSLLESGNWLYTIRATAYQNEDQKGQIVAQVIPVLSPTGSLAVGDFVKAESPYVTALGALDDSTIIFGCQVPGKPTTFNATDNSTAEFWQNDLAKLNWTLQPATGLISSHVELFFSGTNYGIDHTDELGDTHYCNETELLLSPWSTGDKTVGDNNLPWDENDIVSLNLTTGDATSVEDIGQDLGDKNVVVTAFGRIGTSDILLSLDGSSAFHQYQVAEFNTTSKNFTLYLDTWTYILEPHNHGSGPQIAAMAPSLAPNGTADGRLMLTFTVELKDCNDKQMQKGDIAIWTPENWTYEDTGYGSWKVADYGWSYSQLHPGNIKLYLNMNQLGQFIAPSDFLIKSWVVS